MKYIYMKNDNVCEVIPGEDPNFPGVPVTERYAPDFLAQCVEVADEIEVRSGMVYNPDAAAFTEKKEPNKMENEQARKEDMVKITGGGGGSNIE